MGLNKAVLSGLELMPFGKYKGETLLSIGQKDLPYLHWVAYKLETLPKWLRSKSRSCYNRLAIQHRHEFEKEMRAVASSDGCDESQKAPWEE